MEINTTKFKQFMEAIETPPHMLLQFFQEYLKAFQYINSLFRQMIANDFDHKFYNFAKDFVYNPDRRNIDTIVMDLPRWFNRDIEKITEWLEIALEIKDDVEKQHKYINQTINEQLAKSLEEIDFSLIDGSLNKLEKEVIDSKQDWEEQYYGNHEQRLKEIIFVKEFAVAIKKMKQWYKVYIAKAKSHIDSANRRLAAYYAGKNPEKNSKPETDPIEILYHATTAVSSIIQEGFKSRKELGGRSGLGGGPDDTISFTSDLQIAEAIVWSLRRAHEVCSGKMSYQQLQLLSKKLGNNEEALKGVIANFGNWDTINKEEKKKEWMFEYFRYILFFQSKIYNPVFAMVTYKDFEKLDTKEIGIIAAEVEMDQVSEYLASMEEYRVPVIAIKRIWKIPYRGVFNPVVNYK